MSAEIDAQVLLDELKLRPMHYSTLKLMLGGNADRTIDAIDVLLRTGLAERFKPEENTLYREGPSCRTMKRSASARCATSGR